MFQQLSNKTLIEAYENAKFLRLDEEFISLLELELNNRGLSVKVENTNTKKKRNQSIVAHPMTPDLNS
ncbi:sporulation histidine kinase inhibitor Sda [Salirhabdus sp. Marseille-P4669]|uniref:sporulation histidine kinase inhibitor Sda n=1 Tax=Salirhabdus sp. Marseille-P4669 TaxID=2042310 RepID=UPI000C7B96C4|nr:sporulation histidine kinase inhibitor Sda [Salirhabdus sp. Marseille-P4669]